MVFGLWFMVHGFWEVAAVLVIIYLSLNLVSFFGK